MSDKKLWDEFCAMEKERDALRAELGELRSSMEFRTSLIGRTEEERDALRRKVNEQAQDIRNLLALRKKNEALRAELDAQKWHAPVAWMCSNKTLVQMGYRKFSDQKSGDWNVPVYAHPVPASVPEKLCYDSRWEISIDYVDGWNAAIDMMRGKSPSWCCPDCCIAFPFGQPKACPHDDGRCNALLAAAPEAKG
jgi:hypothetical protein